MDQKNKSATWDAISKESSDALLEKQGHKATRAFTESVCRNCPKRNDDICLYHPCPFAKRSVSRLIDALVEIEIVRN